MSRREPQQEALTLTGIAKLQAELMEGRYESPLPVFTEPFTRDSWRKVVVGLRRKEAKCQIPALQERIRGARIMASKMFAGASPWDAMKCMWEIEMGMKGKCMAVDGVARRFMREECYSVHNEFAGRKVSVG